LALLLSSASSPSGLILVLFVIGLRRLGAAQTGAYFSLAPFIGELIAIVFLGERRRFDGSYGLIWRSAISTNICVRNWNMSTSTRMTTIRP
jgi:hypothetical protein